MKREKLARYLCGHCVNGFHSHCYAPANHQCACAEDYHRPSKKVRESMAANMRPDLTGADRTRLMELIADRDAA